MVAETPTMVAYASSSQTYAGLPVAEQQLAQAGLSGPTGWEGHHRREFHTDRAAMQQLMAQAKQATQEPIMATPTRRLVRILIADTNEQIPLDRCLLYKGFEVLTDATDQELFFDIPVADLLAKHNEFRRTIRDKDVRDEVRYLDAIRIRDLKMTVVTVAPL